MSLQMHIKIYLIGDFNDWKVPSDDSDNGAISGKYFQPETPFEPLRSYFYTVRTFLPAGTHRIALYDKDDNVFLTFSNPCEDVEIKNAYESSGTFYIADPRRVISPGDTDLGSCAKNCAFEITIPRDYGAWVEFTQTLIGIAYLEFAADCPEFSIRWGTTEANPPEIEIVTSYYFNLEGLPVSNPTKGVYIEKNGSTTKKVFITE